jgi:hypothetical protein
MPIQPPSVVITSALTPSGTNINPPAVTAVATPGDSYVTIHLGSGTGVPPFIPGVTAVPVSGLYPVLMINEFVRHWARDCKPVTIKNSNNKYLPMACNYAFSL